MPFAWTPAPGGGFPPHLQFTLRSTAMRAPARPTSMDASRAALQIRYEIVIAAVSRSSWWSLPSGFVPVLFELSDQAG